MYHIFFSGKNKNQINYFKSFKRNNPSKKDIYIIPQIQGTINRNKNEIHLKNTFSLFFFFFKLPKNSKVIIHDYSSFIFPIILFVHRKRIEFSWVIWGWDLYSLSEKTFKNSIRKYALGYFSKVHGFKQDFRYLKDYYNKELEFKEFVYSPPTLELNINNSFDSSNIKNNSILVGHSASLDNNHIECLNYICKHIDKSFKVYCILSYGGSSKYIDLVEKKGYELFGNRFIPIFNFMSPNEFNSFLDSIKFAILFNKRQSAVGFIYSCLSRGVQIALFKSSTPFEYLTSRGIILNDIRSIDKINFLNHEKKIIENNFSLINDIYSTQNLKTYYDSLR